MQNKEVQSTLFDDISRVHRSDLSEAILHLADSVAMLDNLGLKLGDERLVAAAEAISEILSDLDPEDQA